MPDDELAQVARAIVAGRRQTQIAEDLGWHKQRVQRRIAKLRATVAAVRGSEWLTPAHSATAVAREWLSIQERLG